jgi:hypothetical protein
VKAGDVSAWAAAKKLANTFSVELATAGDNAWDLVAAIRAINAAGGDGGGGADTAIDTDECFVGDTPVLVPNGAERIDSLRGGDAVLAWSDGRLCPSVVEEIHTAVRDDLVEVDTGTKQIRCSPEHPWLTSRGWIEASLLAAGDVLIPEGTVVDVRPYPGVHTVYNLTVKDESHAFLVAGYVVHNKAFGASGLDMVVPPGFPNDTFPIRASSGERVVVIPQNTQNNSRSFTFNTTVNDSAGGMGLLERMKQDVRRL